MDGPAQQKLQQASSQLEAQLKEAAGSELVCRYQNALLQATAWENEAAFLAGLRFGVNVMLTALPYSYSSSERP